MFSLQYTFGNEKRSASQWLLLSYGLLLYGLQLGMQTEAVMRYATRVLLVLEMASLWCLLQVVVIPFLYKADVGFFVGVFC